MITDKKELIDAKTEVIDGQTFTYGRIPAFYAAELYDKIITNKGIIPQDVKLQMLGYCFIDTDKGAVLLNVSTLVDTYVKKFQTLRTLIDNIFDYNFGFFGDGSDSQK